MDRIRGRKTPNRYTGIEVRPSGRRYWIIRYWVGGKEHRKSLGTYPEVSLKEARERNRVFRQQAPSNSSPSQDTLLIFPYGLPSHVHNFGKILL